MEVLLRQDVSDLGVMGDVVEVADGYARNYLLPRRLAVEVTDSNLQEVERAREAKKQRLMKERERAEQLQEQLQGLEAVVEARATEEGHLFGSVGAEDVADALRSSGFDTIRPANVVLPRPIEQVGEYELEIMCHPEVSAEVLLHVVSLEEEPQ